MKIQIYDASAISGSVCNRELIKEINNWTLFEDLIRFHLPTNTKFNLAKFAYSSNKYKRQGINLINCSKTTSAVRQDVCCTVPRVVLTEIDPSF